MMKKYSLFIPIFLLIIALALIVVFSLPGSPWVPMESGTTQELYDVWGTASTDVFAVGGYYPNSTILHYNGKNWNPMSSNATSTLQGVWGTSPTNVYAVGGGGTILNYNGSQWTPMDTNTTSWFYGIWGVNSSCIFAVGYNWEEDCGAIWHYNGSTWSPMDSGCETHSFHSIWGSSYIDIFAGGSEGMIMHYNGALWDIIYEGELLYCNDIWGIPPNDVFIVGSDILYYDGGTWRHMSNVSLSGIWGTSSLNIYAVGGWCEDYSFFEGCSKSGGSIWHFDGNTWSERRNDTNRHLTSVWGSSATDIFAVGQGGTILHYSGDVFSPRTWAGVGFGIILTIIGIGLGTWFIIRTRLSRRNTMTCPN